MQIYGAANSGVTYATVFHGDLIPFELFLDLHRHYTIRTVYIWAYSTKDFMAAHSYISGLWSRPMHDLDCTPWIRRSTGQLCIELAPSDPLRTFKRIAVEDIPTPQEIDYLSREDQDTLIIDSLTLNQYHEGCYWYLSQHRQVFVPVTSAVNVGGIISLSSRVQSKERLSYLPDVCHCHHTWNLDHGWDVSGKGLDIVMGNGWTRYSGLSCNEDRDNSDFVFCTFWLPMKCRPSDTWLSQANHVFARLNITSNFEDYLVAENLHFTIETRPTTTTPPLGYLFLCPVKDLQIGSSAFKWPACPAYWSLDPSGLERLSTEEATRLGFPSIHLTTMVVGYSWDTRVYAGLRRFHRAKGFEPDTQAVARHLGCPLYKLHMEPNPGFGHDAPPLQSFFHVNVDDVENSPIQPSVQDFANAVNDGVTQTHAGVERDGEYSKCVRSAR
ncbi:hypothetical protein C8F04DRAFT_131485 [Mycena alexandri]|uniref:Uncharacterized protein n=1 Tax=Mycena alexandri TaxID=1745969 RepID=A0AAD6TCJ9_9AGAR|nr:hypothetical protein C8F04DRAFT_131485 [Mycena alexandri]